MKYVSGRSPRVRMLGLGLALSLLSLAGEWTVASAKEVQKASSVSARGRISPRPLQLDGQWSSAQHLQKPESLLTPKEKDLQMWSQRGVIEPVSGRSPASTGSAIPGASRASSDSSWNLMSQP